MTIALVTEVTTVGADATITSLAVNMPSSIVSGNLLLAVVTGNGQDSLTKPSEFTQYGSTLTTPGGLVTVGIFYRWATGTENATYTWSWVTAGRSSAWVGQYSGVDGTNPFDMTTQTVTTTNGNGASTVIPSVTTTMAGCHVFSVLVQNASTSTITKPTEQTQQANLGNPGRKLGVAYEDPGQGATGTRTWTSTGTTDTGGMMTALRPTSGTNWERNPSDDSAGLTDSITQLHGLPAVLATETETSQTVAVHYHRYIAAALTEETDEAGTAINWHFTDHALPITVQYGALTDHPVDRADETETAQPVTIHYGRNITPALVTETETAQAVTVKYGRYIDVGLATDTEIAQTIEGQHQHAAQVANETDTAQPITIHYGRYVAATVVDETETAQPLTIHYGRNVAVGLATETETSQAISPQIAKFVDVETAFETDAARAIVNAPLLATLTLWSDAQADTTQEETQEADSFDLINSTACDMVATTGDFTSSGTSGQISFFQTHFDVGDMKSKTHATTGNHDLDYWWPGAYNYFGASKMGASSSTPYHSVNLNGWHLIFLAINDGSGCPAINSGSTQYNWLHTDLDTYANMPTLVFFHWGRYVGSDRYADNTAASDAWALMLNHPWVEAVFSGHVHCYERFARMNNSGQVDNANGIRQWTQPSIGAGGNGTQQEPGQTGLEAYDDTLPPTIGFMQLKLYTNHYSWRVLTPDGYPTIDDTGYQITRYTASAGEHSVTTADETETAQAVGHSKRVAVGLATETETSQQVRLLRPKPVTQALETEAAQAVTIHYGRNVAVGQATETESAQALSIEREREVAAVVATEAETSQPVTVVRTKKVTVTQATETEAAHALTIHYGRKVAVTQATETEAALSVAAQGRRQIAVNTATDTDTSQTVTVRKSATVAQSTETDIGQAVTSTKTRRYTVTVATETDTSQTVTFRKAVTVVVATETDTAQPMSKTGMRNVAAATAQETETAQALTAWRHTAVVQASDSETATTIGVSKKVAAGVAQETDTGQAVTIHYNRNVPAGQATETETAQTVAVHLHRYIGVALVTETEAAQPVSSSATRNVAAVVATETDTVPGAIGKRKRITATVIPETGLAQTIRPRKQIAATIATETETGIAVGSNKTRTAVAGLATETDATFTIQGIRYHHVTLVTESDEAIAVYGTHPFAPAAHPRAVLATTLTRAVVSENRATTAVTENESRAETR